MKKTLLLVGLFILFSFNNHIYASSPSTNVEIINITGLEKDNYLTLTNWIIKGNSINYLGNECYLFTYDKTMFEYESFDTIYDFSYDDSTNCISDSYNEFLFPKFVENENDIRPLWTIKLKIKENIINDKITINDTIFSLKDIPLNKNTILRVNIQDGTFNDNVIEQYKNNGYDYSLTNEKYTIYKKEYEELKNKKLNQNKEETQNEIKKETNNEIINNKDDNKVETQNEIKKETNNNDNKKNTILYIVLCLLFIFLVLMIIILIKILMNKES